jgi:hypothetical protein
MSLFKTKKPAKKQIELPTKDSSNASPATLSIHAQELSGDGISNLTSNSGLASLANQVAEPIAEVTVSASSKGLGRSNSLSIHLPTQPGDISNQKQVSDTSSSLDSTPAIKILNPVQQPATENPDLNEVPPSLPPPKQEKPARLPPPPPPASKKRFRGAETESIDSSQREENIKGNPTSSPSATFQSEIDKNIEEEGQARRTNSSRRSFTSLSPSNSSRSRSPSPHQKSKGRKSQDDPPEIYNELLGPTKKRKEYRDACRTQSFVGMPNPFLPNFTVSGERRAYLPEYLYGPFENSGNRYKLRMIRGLHPNFSERFMNFLLEVAMRIPNVHFIAFGAEEKKSGVYFLEKPNLATYCQAIFNPFRQFDTEDNYHFTKNLRAPPDMSYPCFVDMPLSELYH